jgi:hypothetical protein
VSIFSLDELVMLTASVPPPAVSIYLPTHRAVPETRQDPIRFKKPPARGRGAGSWGRSAGGRGEGLAGAGLRSHHDLTSR